MPAIQHLFTAEIVKKHLSENLLKWEWCNMTTLPQGGVSYPTCDSGTELKLLFYAAIFSEQIAMVAFILLFSTMHFPMHPLTCMPAIQN